MTIGPQDFEGLPKVQMSLDQALQAQFAKVGQLSFQIDIMVQQMRVLENENKQLKEQLKNTELIDAIKEK